MSTLPSLLSPHVVKAAASTGTLAALQSASQGTIEVGAAVYTLIAVLLGLVGVYLARLVTIGDENRKLGRVQTLRETGPLTWIGVLIVCPFIWHFNIAIPWASMIGLGVGYSVKVVLKIFGGGAVGAARAIAQRAADALADTPDAAPAPAAPPAVPALDAPGARPPAVILPPTDHMDGEEGLMKRLGDVPGTLPPDGKSE